MMEIELSALQVLPSRESEPGLKPSSCARTCSSTCWVTCILTSA
ncbi:hypothetical protein [Sphaerisporangium sp. NPDC051011]